MKMHEPGQAGMKKMQKLIKQIDAGRKVATEEIADYARHVVDFTMIALQGIRERREAEKGDHDD